MSLSGIDLLFSNFQTLTDRETPSSLMTSLLDDAVDIPAENTVVCDVCGRPNHQWLIKDKMVKCSPYPNAPEEHCLACHSLFQSAPQHFGNGRSDKIGMNVGVGCLITEERRYLYATKKNFDRLSTVKVPIFDELIEKAGFDMILDAMTRLPSSGDYLLITDFGRKKSRLVSNMKISTVGNLLHVCSESDLFSMQQSQLLTADDFSKTEASLVSNGKDGWLDLMLKSTLRYLSMDDASIVNQLLQSNSQLREATTRLPKNPHTKDFILRLLRRSLENA